MKRFLVTWDNPEDANIGNFKSIATGETKEEVRALYEQVGLEVISIEEEDATAK